MNLIQILVCVALASLVEAMALYSIFKIEPTQHISTVNKIQETATEKLQGDESLVANKNCIFLNPLQRLGDDQCRAEQSVEINSKPKIQKVKRSSNVIEEENRATSESGYKYTWRDTRLFDNTGYKNVHYNII